MSLAHISFSEDICSHHRQIVPADGVVSCSAGPVPRRSDILLALADAFERGTEGILTVASGRQHRRSSRLHTAFIWQEMSGGAYQCMRAFVSRF